MPALLKIIDRPELIHGGLAQTLDLVESGPHRRNNKRLSA